MEPPQFGHAERGGLEIDFEVGSLYMHTFKKLPMHMPKIKTAILPM